jgi:hypothetical protein
VLTPIKKPPVKVAEIQNFGFKENCGPQAPSPAFVKPWGLHMHVWHSRPRLWGFGLDLKIFWQEPNAQELFF